MSVKGDRELIRALQKLGPRATAAINQGVYLTAQQVRGDAIRSIQSQSQGETVTRYSQGGNSYEHTASAPGDAPNTDTGKLVQSIAIEPTQPAETVSVGTGVEYGEFLEVGTTKMEPRPWLTPAMDGNRASLRNNIANAVRRLSRERQ